MPRGGSQAAYDGIVANITDRSQWPKVDKGFHLHEPIGKKRGPGRQVKNRKKPAAERSGKATRQSICKGCGETGHRQGSWRCSLTGTKKRKRTKKTSVKPGRKKSKAGDIPAPEQATPRTRLALAREVAMRARLQAEEAQLRASEAMEAAEVAARAANTELLAEPVPIEFQLPAPATPSGPSTRRRLSLGAAEPVPAGELQFVQAVPKKITPVRKKLSPKIKKK